MRQVVDIPTLRKRPITIHKEKGTHGEKNAVCRFSVLRRRPPVPGDRVPAGEDPSIPLLLYLVVILVTAKLMGRRITRLTFPSLYTI